MTKMIKTILVATDGSDHAKKAVSLANDLAKTQKARLVFVHAALRDATPEDLRKVATRGGLTKDQLYQLDHYESDMKKALSRAGDGAIGTILAPVDLQDAVGTQILERAKASAAKAGIKNVSAVLFRGDPADGILETAKREKADMIVIGTRGLGDFKSLVVGSVTHKVISRAPCPCLSVK